MHCGSENEDTPENKFVQFLKYDFKNDERFQFGLQQLIKCSSQKTGKQEYFMAKLFYYSKYFTPISYQEFMDWMKRKQDTEMPGLQNIKLECCSKNDVLDKGKTIMEENVTENIENTKTRPSDIEQYDIGLPIHDHDKLSKPIATKCDTHNDQSLISSGQNPTSQGPSTQKISATQNSATAVKLFTETFNGSNTSLECSAQNCSESVINSETVMNFSALNIDGAQCPEPSAQNSNVSLTSTDSKNVTQSTSQTFHGSSTSTLPVCSAGNVDESLTNKSDPQRAASPEAAPKSFSDLVEFIQSGKPIPGIVHVDVKPTNTPETPSVITRMKKPWE